MADFKDIQVRSSRIADSVGRWFTVYTVTFIVYAYLTKHYKLIGKHHLFIFILVAAAIVFVGWTGYLLKGAIDRRLLYHGFRRLSINLSYRIEPDKNGHSKYILEFVDKVRATSDHLMVYPVRHKWSGKGQELTPIVSGAGQQLVTVINKQGKIGPYIEKRNSRDGQWCYYFIAFNPPVHRSKKSFDVNYLQEFHDDKGSPEPYLSYTVLHYGLRELKLQVKVLSKPKSVSTCHYKPHEPEKPSGVKDGMHLYDAKDNWISWTIKYPRKGYEYSISWEL